MIREMRLEVDHLKNGVVLDEFDVERLEKLSDKLNKYNVLFGSNDDIEQLEADIETLWYVYLVV